jgi:ligand-binding sensor domain-containing protein
VSCAPLIDPSQIVAHPSQAGQIWVVSAQGVWTTTDFGVRWQPLNQGLIDFTDYASGVLHAVTETPSGQLYLATSRGLYTQSAANPLWTKTGLPSFSSREVVGLLLTDSNPTMLWVNTAQAGTFVHRAK